MDLRRLREETRSEHEATEGLMPLTEPGLTLARYVAVLRSLLPLVSGWERWARQAAPPELQPLLAVRRRSPLLERDLAVFLGPEAHFVSLQEILHAEQRWAEAVRLSGADFSSSNPEDSAKFLGALYVVEGSTLGGRFIARHTESTFALPSGYGDAYFSGHAEATGRLWREVTAHLAAVPNELSAIVIDAARRAFVCFGDLLRAGLETPLPAANLAADAELSPRIEVRVPVQPSPDRRAVPLSFGQAAQTLSEDGKTVSEEIVATQQPCDEEPIRIPGAVQQHGFLLLTDAVFERVLVASENAQRFLNLPMRLILGAKLATLFERELLSSLQLLRLGDTPEREGLVTFLGSYRLNNEFFSVTTHASGTDRILEFELQDRLVGPEMMNGVITNFVGILSRLTTQAELCDALAEQVAGLTGFDRVLLYSFDDEGHGTVLSEVNNGRLPSYLGLRFPASDIPKQARELYVLNTVRIIPDAGYTPSPLAGLPGQNAAALDLSLSGLRSVSPTHLEYMRNMGTLSSMSVSLVTEGRLWGLISGHHAEPKLIPYLVRSACDMLTKVGSTQLAGFHTAARLQQTVHFHAVQRNLLTELASEQNYLDGLARLLPDLLEVTKAQGVALIIDDHIRSFGEVPDDPDLDRLRRWLNAQDDLELWSTSHLSLDLPSGDLDWVDRLRERASGLLAIRFSSVQHRYLLWFRPELVKQVRWAGEPGKIIDSNQTLHPRASFAEWKEIVRGRSEPWTDVEMESARDFRSALTTIGLRRAEEAVELSEARFQQLTQAMPVRVFTADDSGALTYTNERWQETGLTGKGRWFDEKQIFPEDAALCRERWAAAVQQNRGFEAEVRLCTPVEGGTGGTERWNVVRAVPFQRVGAERAGWIGCFIDMTESKEREAALRMNEKLALTGRMTSVIAHEINNPLEAITNLMYLLRAEINNDGPATTYIGMVESELERISGITKQTLRWNRESSDERDRFRAGAIVEDVLRLFAGKIRNRQITVRVEGSRDVPICGVIGQLRQVLANLISNAIDASPVSGAITVKILDSQSEGQIGFAIQDNGGGIPPALQRRIFEPFYSTKGDLGNGLGLYISREIVERHGGEIQVDSTPGQGTLMRVLLPVADNTPSPQRS